MIYLIAHLVRGEPTYDIAVEQKEGTPSDPGPWFITSLGWRAYPYWRIELNWLLDEAKISEPGPWPEDWPDFFTKTEMKKAKAISKDEAIDLDELGLL